MIQVDPLWWQTLFDDVYLITDANIVCNPTLTKQEVDIVEQALRLREIALSKTKGLLRDRTFAERLYPPAHLQKLLQAAGFIKPTIHHNAFIFDAGDDTDYGIATHRMLVTARKA